ncbi:hypothetical protein JNJ66_03810 [Candidatus Saccharibacteria bacterium]|nr:hypothetical protein [Candidatus Saccharibacteria bacterium]
MQPEQSTPVTWIGQEHLGYVIQTTFSDENTQLILAWLEGLRQATGDNLYFMGADQLHITVLDWVAPLFDYGGINKQELYESLKDEYAAAFRAITDSVRPFEVHFNELRVMPNTIILTGQDGGQFQSVRTQFMERVALPEGAKQPPTIIHSSLTRFIGEPVALAPYQEYVAAHPLELTQRIEDFRLVKTGREPMLTYEVIEQFQLGGV